MLEMNYTLTRRLCLGYSPNHVKELPLNTLMPYLILSMRLKE
jgi:hypothetical protein